MASKKRCLGVDLGSHTIKVAELTHERDAVRITKLVAAPVQVDPGASPAERQTSIAKTLRELLRSNKISTKDAVFALPGQTAFVRRFRLPFTTQERLERIIRYEARQQIPFPLDRTQLEYQIYNIPEENEVEVLLVAVRQDHIQDFVSLIGRTGLSPLCIAISPFALYNFHASQQKSYEDLTGQPNEKKTKKTKKSSFFSLSIGKKKKTAAETEPEEEPEAEPEAPVFEEVQAYVNVGASAMDLAIARLGREVFLGFTRSIPTAGNEITRSIQEKCRLSSFADAEKVKQAESRLMTFDFDPETAGDEYNVTACQAATATLDRLIADIRRSLDFYISQPDGMAVDSILLSGAQSALPGFVEYVEEKLGLSVSRAESLTADWLRLADNVSPAGRPLDIPTYSIAIGLGFQGIGVERVGVDFLPRERKVIRDFPYKRAALMLALLAGGIVFASQAGSNYANIYERQKQAIEEDLTRRRELDKLATDAQATQNKAAELYEKLAPALDERDFWIQFLADLQVVKPAAVLVDTLVMQEDGSVMIIGIGESRNLAADFTRNLQGLLEEPKKAPQLTDLREVDYAGFDRRVWNFTIELQLDLDRNRYIPQKPQAPAAPQRRAPAGPMAPGGPYAPPAGFMK